MLANTLMPRKLRSLLLTSAVALTAPLLQLVPARPAHADQWALLIGIDQYEDVNHINPLGGAAADARALAKTLHDAAGFSEDHIKVLVSDGETKPTRTNILNAIARLAANAKAGDTVFVLYSGHGVDIDGAPYLLPYDTSALTNDTITDTALETAKFRARLRQVKAGALILAFDMCRSDPRKIGKDVTASDNKLSHDLARGLDFRQATNPGPADANPASPIAVTLYSCAEGERSYEWQDKGRGYFSYYLEQGLKGAAADPVSHNVTIGSLANYLGRTVHTAVDLDEHHAQTPYPSLDGPGASDFVLASSVAPVIPAVPVVAPVANIVNTHARLKITVNAPNPTITVDSKPLASGADYVANLLDEDKKTVRVKVTAPGYDGQALDVELTKGVVSPLVVTLTALTPSASVPPAAVAAVVNAVHPTTNLNVLITTLHGYGNVIRTASFSPDGKYIVIAGDDGTAKIWDAQTGLEVRTLDLGVGHIYISAASFSLDGNKIVTNGENHTAIVWDALTGQQMRTLSGHSDFVQAAAFSPDGRYIITGSRDHTAKIWDAQTGQELHTLSGHNGTIYAASFSPDGRYIVTGSQDSSAKVWDAQTGQEIRTLHGHSSIVYSASFSPDSQYIVTASNDNTAKVWDVQTGQEIRTLSGHMSYVDTASFSPDGKYIVTGSWDTTAKVWDAQTGQEIRTLSGHSVGVTAAAFSPDSRYIVTGSLDKTAKVWEVATGKSAE